MTSSTTPLAKTKLMVATRQMTEPDTRRVVLWPDAGSIKSGHDDVSVDVDGASWPPVRRGRPGISKNHWCLASCRTA